MPSHDSISYVVIQASSRKANEAVLLKPKRRVYERHLSKFRDHGVRRYTNKCYSVVVL